jgi:beta-glucuronidase
MRWTRILPGFLATLLVALLFPADAYADEIKPTALTLADGRESIRLDGEWHYIVDPMRMGLRQGRMRNFSRDIRPTDQELIEYDWANSPKLNVPGDWTTQIETLRWYEGMVWHYKRFNAEPADGNRRFLQFEAVNYHAHVYVNGTKIGEHEGGFTPFAFDVTDAIKPGENFVVVGVDSRHLPESVPATQVDWWNYGGITRPVHLITTGRTYIRTQAVTMTRDGLISADIMLDGEASAGREVTISFPELRWSIKGVTNPQGRLQLTAKPPRNLQRWSPEKPKMYRVMIDAGGSGRIEDWIGFRTIQVKGKQILLNGKPLFLRGISLHEETISSNANRNIYEPAARALLSEAKALGANFVRLAHYPHSETMVRMADEMGLMVWSEIPIYWDMAFANPETLKLARQMLAESMVRDMSRASIVIWSVGNETPETDARLSFMRALIDDVRARDPSRLVSAALHDDADTSSGADGMVRVDDPIGAYLDVLAMNRYEAWYGYRTPLQIDEVNWSVAYDKPLIFSEFGADALLGYRADPMERWSEDYQKLLYEQTFEMADRIPNLVGTSPWILKDFRSPRRFHGKYQEYWNRKGLIDPEGKRKLAWQVVQDYYRKHAGQSE